MILPYSADLESVWKNLNINLLCYHLYGSTCMLTQGHTAGNCGPCLVGIEHLTLAWAERVRAWGEGQYLDCTRFISITSGGTAYGSPQTRMVPTDTRLLI